MRSMVEGAQASRLALAFQDGFSGEARAPSTALRAVPLPRFAVAERKFGVKQK
jgi:hypothetical protein